MIAPIEHFTLKPSFTFVNLLPRINTIEDFVFSNRFSTNNLD